MQVHKRKAILIENVGRIYKGLDAVRGKQFDLSMDQESIAI